MLENLNSWVLDPNHIRAFIHIAVLGIGGFWLTYVLGRVLERRLLPHIGSPVARLFAKVMRYLLYIVILATILGEMGFKLTAILGAVLGAAGVAGVALGFAAQTSLSNLISGLFLVWERPFKPGDVIEADGVTGVVHGITFMSTSLCTVDNRIVRIPNETLVKGRIMNHSRLPIRRVDLVVSVSSKADARCVMQLLLEIAAAHPKCLRDPKSVVIFTGLGASSMDFLLGAWANQGDLEKFQNDLLCAIHQRFDTEGIALPSPHPILATGAELLPVRAQS